MTRIALAMLMQPQGSAAATDPVADWYATQAGTWYAIRAGTTRGVAEIDIFGDIGTGGVTSMQFANDLRALGDVSQINLRLNSPGGAVFEGMAMYNLLKSHKAWKVCTVMGMAASMGSVVAMACNEVRMPANAVMMVHMPWGIQGGTADAMRKYAEVLDMFGDSMLETYMAKTGKSADEIKALLEEETWMTAAQAVELGFADKVLDAVEAFGTLNSNRFKDFTKMPASAKILFEPQGNTTVVPPTGQQTVEQIAAAAVAQALAADGARRSSINAAFLPFAGHEALRDTCLNDTACTVASTYGQVTSAAAQVQERMGTLKEQAAKAGAAVNRIAGKASPSLGNIVPSSALAADQTPAAEAVKPFPHLLIIQPLEPNAQPFYFNLDTAAFDELRRQTGFRWAAQERLSRPIAQQAVGQGEDKLSLKGVIYPGRGPGLKQLDTLRSFGRMLRPVTLTTGYGEVLGNWCLVSIDEEQSNFLAGAIPRRQNFTLEFVSYGDDMQNI